MTDQRPTETVVREWYSNLDRQQRRELALLLRIGDSYLRHRIMSFPLQDLRVREALVIVQYARLHSKTGVSPINLEDFV